MVICMVQGLISLKPLLVNAAALEYWFRGFDDAHQAGCGE